MMANRWVQASLLFGFTVGLWISAWINFAYPFATFYLAYLFAFPAIWLLGKARGTDGWKERKLPSTPPVNAMGNKTGGERI